MLSRFRLPKLVCVLAAYFVWCCATVSAAEGSHYSTPGQIQSSATGNGVLVWETGAGTVCVIDPAQGTMVRRGARPDANLISTAGFSAVSADGKWVALIDPWEPRLLVANVPFERLAEMTLADCRSIPLGEHATPQALAITPDSRHVLVACDTPGTDDRTIAVVAVETGHTVRRIIPGSSNLRGLAIDPTGTYALAVHLRPKSHLPSTQIEQGWVFTNALSYVSLSGPERVVSFPLDIRTQGFANPEGIVIDPQGDWAYIAHAGADVVSVVDLRSLLRLANERANAAAAQNATAGVPTLQGDDLRLTRRYVAARIPVAADPRGMAISPDGKTLAVANRLADSVSIVDTTSRQVVRTVKLSDIAPDAARRGEILFHSGKLAFGSQFSCASCHPDGHADGLNWDLPADGFNNFHNTKSLLSVAGTQPYGWLGESATLRERFSGTLRQLFQYEPADSDVDDLEAYLGQLSYPDALPRRVDPAGDEARRGGALFAGIAGCSSCHRGALLTDHRAHDVGTGTEGGVTAYDTPSLVRVAETAPYLHDSRARTLEEVFDRHNSRAQHGNAAVLSRDQFADLIVYLRSL